LTQKKWLDVWKKDAKCIRAEQGLSRAAACLGDKIGCLVQDRDEREYILYEECTISLVEKHGSST
jgi:hypothetical protein